MPIQPSDRNVATEPTCYVRATTGLSGTAHRTLPAAPVMLFIGQTAADEADTAARDAATDMGSRLDRRVLLLDCGVNANAQLAHFAARHALAPHPPAILPPAGQAALHFHPLHDSTLWVSTLTPDHAADDEAFWHDQARLWHSTRRRLLELFGAIVVAMPGLRRSPRGLAFARQVEATILVVRDGPDAALRADAMRAQVQQAGGRPAGIVLTGCGPDALQSASALLDAAPLPPHPSSWNGPPPHGPAW